jgi:mRNA interferase MazF
VVKRGEIWLAALDPTLGSEIRKTRPCVIISPAEMHDYLRTAIVAPMTTGSRPAPFRIPVRFEGKKGWILLDQIRAVDKSRLTKRLGAVTPKALSATLGTLREAFAD